MEDQVLSTSSQILSIVKKGRPIQSTFSDVFIKTIEKEIHLSIIACYVQSGEFNVFYKGKPTQEFVDEVLLTIYVKEPSFLTVQKEPEFERKIEMCFWNTVQSLGIKWSYKRVYSQEELVYYGFANSPRWQWDLEKIRKPSQPPKKNFKVKIESLDRLALYHLLSEKVTHVGQYIRRVYECNVKVYVGFLDSVPYLATHYIVFDTKKEYKNFLSFAHPDTVAIDIQRCLQTDDLWDVLEIWPYRPQYYVWNELGKEKKMCLLRESHD